MKDIGISQVDVLFAGGSYPIEFLFFYRRPFDTKRLRKALKRISADFWPAFGTYADGVIRGRSYREEDHYDEVAGGPDFDIGVGEDRAIEAAAGFHRPDPEALFHVTVLRMKTGLALIPALSHLAGDGYSYFYLLSLLAALSRPERAPGKRSLALWSFKPHHRRTALKEFAFRGAAGEAARPPEKLRLKTDEILRKDVTAVIGEAAEEGRKISSNDVLTAAAVKKMIVRPGAFSGEDIEVTIPIDVRNRVKEYGRKFFGNGIWLHTFTVRRSEAETAPLRDLAQRVRASMPVVSSEAYAHYLAGLEDLLVRGERDGLRPFAPERGCLVTNLSRLPTDKLDFGGGPPGLVVPLTAERHGAAVLASGENFRVRYEY